MDDDMESEQRYVNSLTREFNNEAEINAILKKIQLHNKTFVN